MVEQQFYSGTIAHPLASPVKNVREWTLSGHGGASGSGSETVYGAYGYLPDPKPVGSGLFSVPGCELYIESGGSVNAYVEFWKDTGTGTGTGQLSEASIGTLSAGGTPLSGSLSYYLGSGLFWTGAVAGTYYSPWKVIGGTGISGVAYGIIQAGAGCSILFSGVNHSGSADGSIYLQLANSGSGVISEYELVRFSGSQEEGTLDTGGASGTITDLNGGSFIAAAHAGNIYQARLKLSVASATGGAGYIQFSYEAYYLAYR